MEFNSDELSGLLVLGTSLQMGGRQEEAIAVHERMGELYPFLRWLTGVTYAKAGRLVEARRIAVEIEAETKPGEIDAMTACGLAVLHGTLGEVDTTHWWLTHEPNHCWRVAVAIDPIAGVPRDVLVDPRFDAFMERLNLPWWVG